MDNYSVKGIKKILMERDNMSEKDAINLIKEAIQTLHERLEDGDDIDSCYDICEEFFGLEPDYLMAII